MIISGGCRCGAVRYSIDAEPRRLAIPSGARLPRKKRKAKGPLLRNLFRLSVTPTSYLRAAQSSLDAPMNYQLSPARCVRAACQVIAGVSQTRTPEPRRTLPFTPNEDFEAPHCPGGASSFPVRPPATDPSASKGGLYSVQPDDPPLASWASGDPFLSACLGRVSNEAHLSSSRIE